MVTQERAECAAQVASLEHVAEMRVSAEMAGLEENVIAAARQFTGMEQGEAHAATALAASEVSQAMLANHELRHQLAQAGENAMQSEVEIRYLHDEVEAMNQCLQSMAQQRSADISSAAAQLSAAQDHALRSAAGADALGAEIQQMKVELARLRAAAAQPSDFRSPISDSISSMQVVSAVCSDHPAAQAPIRQGVFSHAAQTDGHAPNASDPALYVDAYAGPAQIWDPVPQFLPPQMLPQSAHVFSADSPVCRRSRCVLRSSASVSAAAGDASVSSCFSVAPQMCSRTS